MAEPELQRVQAIATLDRLEEACREALFIGPRLLAPPPPGFVRCQGCDGDPALTSCAGCGGTGIVRFAEEVIGVELLPWQRETLQLGAEEKALRQWWDALPLQQRKDIYFLHLARNRSPSSDGNAGAIASDPRQQT